MSQSSSRKQNSARKTESFRSDDIRVRSLAEHNSKTPRTPSVVMSIGRVLDMICTCDTAAMVSFGKDAKNVIDETITMQNAVEVAQAAATCDPDKMGETTGLICNLAGGLELDTIQGDLLEESRNDDDDADDAALSPRSLASSTIFSHGIPDYVVRKENDTVCDELTLDGALLAMERREELEKLRKSGVSALDVSEETPAKSYSSSSKGAPSSSSDDCSEKSKNKGLRKMFPKRRQSGSHNNSKMTQDIAMATAAMKAAPPTATTAPEKKEGSLRRLRTAFRSPRAKNVPPTRTTTKLKKVAE